ncbi:MAG TPA: sodium/solute symporter [bacterium]|nr:sodium/solute symporter [bacterium]
MENAAVGLSRTWDIVVLIAYLLGTLALGVWCSLRIKNTEGYFLGGRQLPGWAIGISILAAAISSITFLAYPGSAYEGNFSRVVPGLAFPAGAIIAIFIFVPFYRRVGFISAYTYFERRFGLWGRIYVCILFVLGQIWRVGLILYLLSLPLTMMFPQFDKVPLIIGIGVFVAFYTVIGGLEAVIWTDVFQTFVLFLGGLAVVLIVFLNVDGGALTVFSMGMANGKFSLFGQNVASMFDFSLAKDTLLMLLIIGTIGSTQEFALDQNKIQRYCSTPTTRAARNATWTGAAGCIPAWLLFMFVGTCLWVFYQAHPERLPREMLADEIFPYFILNEMPQGFGGLVIAGLLAAAMSTLTSCISAMSLVTTEDIYKRLLAPGRDDNHYLKAAKVISTLSGISMIVVALGLTKLRQETILEMAFIVGAMLGGGIGGLFFIGFCSRRANSFGGAVGIVLAVVATFGMTYIEAKAMSWDSDVEWMISDAVKSGEVNSDTIQAEIRAKAEAEGVKMKLADVRKAEKERIREILAERIQTNLGPKPPHLGEAIGIHPFMMAVAVNLIACVIGFLFSFFRPAPREEQLAGLTWWTRHAKQIET